MKPYSRTGYPAHVNQSLSLIHIFNLYCDKVLTADILNGLKEKKYDLGFCSMIDNEPLIEFIPVARQELVVIVPSDHPLAAKEEVCLEDTIPVSYTHLE